MLKEGDVTYKQQCNVILKPKYLRLQMLLVIFYDITFFCQIHENFEKKTLLQLESKAN
jgi:hypothetical protein